MTARKEKQQAGRGPRTTLTLPTPLYRQLKQVADREHRTISGQIAHMFENATKAEGAQP